MTSKYLVYGLFLFLIAIIVMSCTPSVQPTPASTSPGKPTPEPLEATPTPQTVSLTGGVTVTLPWQGQDTSIEILTKGPGGSPGGSPDDKVVFIRALADFKVADKSGKTVHTFNPPMRIVATYTDEDLATAGGSEKNLVLGSYDAESKIWVPISDGNTILSGDGTIQVETAAWSDKWACMCAQSSATPPPQ